MGQSSSRNVIETLVDITTDIVNNYQQDCSASSDSRQKIDIAGCSNVVIENVDQGQYTYVNVKCLQQADTQSQMEAQITQAMKQAAEAITQQFGMPSSNTSENITRSTVRIGSSIVNEYYLNCASASFTQQEIQCRDSTNVVISGVNNEQTTEVISDCVMDAVSRSSASTQLEQEISQTAVAKQESIFEGLVNAFVLGIILLVVVLVVTGMSS